MSEGTTCPDVSANQHNCNRQPLEGQSRVAGDGREAWPPWIRKKVAVLGDFAVGKTSLVRRFVDGTFAVRYLATLGVNIRRKFIDLAGLELDLVLWDFHGENEITRIKMLHLQDTAGLLLVVDGTRRETLDTALMLLKSVRESCGDAPFVLTLNKVDLEKEWDIDEETVMELTAQGWALMKTSAATGMAVEEAFLTLARKLART
jgi:small GTP-binding protein